MTQELGRSNKELEQFAYVASHDLQEPLRMVGSFTQLLARRYKGKLDKEADEFIGFAVDGAVRMQAMINDLLSYSRVVTHGHALKPTNCEDVLNQALMNLKVTIEDNRAEVTHEPLPSVYGDEIQVVQLFQNLIGNAIKYCENKDPRVHIAAEQIGLREWQFTVSDNGIGIDAKDYERIFVIFQRLHSSGQYSGSGIGLAICKRIVERHHGRIWVESDIGKGSRFCFTLLVQNG